MASVSETLGHSDKAVTLRMYTHANEESKRKVSNPVEELLKLTSINVSASQNLAPFFMHVWENVRENSGLQKQLNNDPPA